MGRGSRKARLQTWSLLGLAIALAGVMLSRTELVIAGMLVGAFTALAWCLLVWPHNHWRGFRRHRW